MAEHARFRFASLADLASAANGLGADLEFDADLSPLGRTVRVGPLSTPNALGVHPMEGCDGEAGAPGPLTFRRYERFAAGGAGLLWFEATAVVPEGRANPNQLWLHAGNVGAFTRLLDRTYAAARESAGSDHLPLAVLQLTHSGRVSRPAAQPRPVIAYHNPVLEAASGLATDYPVVGDDELERLEDDFVAAARLARQAGFPVVDLKATHGYLTYELLSARDRPGRYGGSFANRTRFLLNLVEKVRDAVPDLTLAVRLGFCDGLPYPYGWGASAAVPGGEDFSEPTALVRELYVRGVRLLSVSAGIGKWKSQLIQPANRWNASQIGPVEHPLEGVARLFRAARAAQLADPRMVVVGSGYSWLRQYFPFAAAANLRHGRQQIAAVGRLAFAYPEFARDLRERGTLDWRRVCTTCGQCSDLMRVGAPTGCPVRDREVYQPFYRQYCR